MYTSFLLAFHRDSLCLNQGVKANGFYLLPYLLALRTFSLSALVNSLLHCYGIKICIENKKTPQVLNIYVDTSD